MKKALLVLAAALAASSPASALVYAVTNRSPHPVTITVHNDSCDDKTRVIATPGYGQMDWRGGCTDSCAGWFKISWTDSKGNSKSTLYVPEFFSGRLMSQACNTQHFTITDTPDDGPALITGTTGTWSSR